jgi:hypothetical protein
MVLLAAAAAPTAASAASPEVRDDGVGEEGLPANLNVISGWVGNETASDFSVFMKMVSLAPPADGSETIHYHFHFQVTRTDGATSLYHAMVHHSASGDWVWMVQRWVSSNGTGAWGDTHGAAGFADAAAGTVEVHVAKAWVESPKVDIAKNTWTIDSFYIHADLVRNADGAIVTTDTAPNSGTMGSYAVSVGAPIGSGDGSSSPLILAGLVAVAVLALAFLFWPRPGSRGRI